MITIKPIFSLGQRVFIKEINLTGRVMAYHYEIELQYKVRYFDNGEARNIFFYENELIEAKDKKQKEYLNEESSAES